MLVYRICNEREITLILKERSCENIGNYFSNNQNKNTHNYKENKRYIHFFRNYSDIFYFDFMENKYICTYDIPDKILKTGEGKGYYLDRIMFQNVTEVFEYAVESNLIDFEYLKQIDMITSIVSFEEYLFGDFKNKIREVYSRKKEPQKTLNKIKSSRQ